MSSLVSAGMVSTAVFTSPLMGLCQAVWPQSSFSRCIHHSRWLGKAWTVPKPVAGTGCPSCSVLLCCSRWISDNSWSLFIELVSIMVNVIILKFSNITISEWYVFPQSSQFSLFLNIRKLNCSVGETRVLFCCCLLPSLPLMLAVSLFLRPS